MVTPIVLYQMHYFIDFVGSYFSFRFAYLVLVAMYQYRVFYYLFYFELIHFELKSIRNEMQRFLVAPQNIDRQSNDENLDIKLKRISQKYQLIYELNECTNHVFEWSQIPTVMYCFYLLLSGANWAYLSLLKRSIKYIFGKFFRIKLTYFVF